jgi:hypothetical protein
MISNRIRVEGERQFRDEAEQFQADPGKCSASPE